MEERSLATYPTWERYVVLAHAVMNLSIRDRRHLFQLACTATSETFFPHFGFTLAEFATWYVLGDKRRAAVAPPPPRGVDLVAG